jgi:protein-disulfide isomerase
MTSKISNFASKLLFSAIFLSSTTCWSQDTSKPTSAQKAAPTSKLTDSDLNAMIDQLTKSGKLDTAINAGINRFVAAQKTEAAKAQETEKTKRGELAKNARKVNPARDHIYGNAKADWSYIVYSDLECPYCKMHSGMPEGAARLVGLDKVNVVFRHLPLPMHGDNAKKEAVAAECVAKQAGNDGFFKFVNDVLKTSQLNGQGLKDGDAGLAKLAVSAGAKDESAFVSCMQDPKSTENVKEDLEDGTKAGVSGTPGNIIRNNKTGLSVAAHGFDQGGESSIAAHIKSVMSGTAK